MNQNTNKIDKLIRRKLDNKTNILFIPSKNTDIVAVGIFIKVGSRYENAQELGISHFLEHMIFKGTQDMSSTMLAKKLDQVGARYNAETSYETTHYYIYGSSDHLNLFLDTISSIYLEPAFRSEDISMEKGVVLEEFNMIKDDPDEIIHNFVQSKLFRNSQLKNPIIGTKENIMSFTRKNLMNFRKKHYIPENTIIVVSGKFDLEATYEKIKKNFNDYTSNVEKFNLCKTELPEQEKSEIYSKINNKISQAHLTITFKSEDIYSKNSDCYDLIGDILTSGSSSVLFELLRGKMGIAYNINAYNMSYIYEGAFVIDLGVDNNNVKKAIKAIIKELGKLVRKGVSKEDLEKAKNIKITSLSIGLQSPQHKLNYYGLNELYFNTSEKKEHNKEIDIETRIANYKAITRKQINDVIKDLFKKETMNIFTYGKKLDI